MRKWIITLMVLITAAHIDAQKIESLRFNEFQPLLKQQNDTTYVINFWATWCVPCIEELPWFMTTAYSRANQNVRFIFVSLDFPKQMESRLIPFIEKNHYTERIILMNETNTNHFINQVDSTWSGAIPATLIYKNNQRHFIEQSLSKDALNHKIDSINNL